MVAPTRARAEHGSRKIQTGVAISATELCAVDIRLRGAADRAWRATLEPAPSDGASWPSLASALADLARTLGVVDGTLAVSLMPPLAEVRRVELPPVRDDELQRLLSRNASRYFVGARTPQTVGALRVGRRVRGAPTPVIAAAAPVRLVSMIRAAAAQAGWAVDSIAPAESAWAAATLALWPTFVRQTAFGVVTHEERTDLLQLENGRLVGVRRFRAGAADAAMIVDTIAPGARVGVAGTDTERRALTTALAGLGLNVSSPSGEWMLAAERGDLLAAHFAGSSAGPVLRAEDSIQVERARVRKATLATLGAAAALLVLAALVELWGVHRQLRLVQEERARIRPALSSTLIGRTTVDATYRRLAVLSGVERSMPHWSDVITTLTDAIPDDAHLTAIRAREDSLVIDGLAVHAARVFDGLEVIPDLFDVKAAAPVRRELQEDGTALDHFTIAARVKTSVAPAGQGAMSPAANPSARRTGQ